jgi:hypothetical protein
LLFKEGKSIAEIAKLRDYAETTIQAQLVRAVAQGKLPIASFIDPQLFERICQAVPKLTELKMSEALAACNDAYSYAELLLVRSLLQEGLRPQQPQPL